jgi:ribosomal protein L17
VPIGTRDPRCPTILVRAVKLARRASGADGCAALPNSSGGNDQLKSRRLEPERKKSYPAGQKAAKAEVASQDNDNTQVVLQKLFDEIGPRFADRPGDSTLIFKREERRLRDAGRTVFIELLRAGETKVKARAAAPAPAPRVTQPPAAPTPAPAAGPEHAGRRDRRHLGTFATVKVRVAKVALSRCGSARLGLPHPEPHFRPLLPLCLVHKPLRGWTSVRNGGSSGTLGVTSGLAKTVFRISSKQVRRHYPKRQLPHHTTQLQNSGRLAQLTAPRFGKVWAWPSRAVQGLPTPKLLSGA